jgi:hypothetical protein
MTSEELVNSNPRVRGEVTFTHEGKTYNSFVCHGCQTCFNMDENDNIEESYPHFLSPLKETLVNA